MHEFAGEDKPVGDDRDPMRLGRRGHAGIQAPRRRCYVHGATLADLIRDFVGPLP